MSNVSKAIRKQRYPVGSIKDKRNNTPTPEDRELVLKRRAVEEHRAEIERQRATGDWLY